MFENFFGQAEGQVEAAEGLTIRLSSSLQPRLSCICRESWGPEMINTEWSSISDLVVL